MDSALPVMVVDDARFSRIIITRSLADSGFRDVRYAASADEALSQLEERPADVVIADWIMPGIDGLQMTGRIREMDSMLEHYTYVMLMSGQEERTAITRAFEEGVDDFVSKAALRTHLMPRIWAACRTAGFNNGLLSSNRELREQIATLERRNMIDPVTGLGNERFTDRTLSDMLRQVASRGGAACIVLIALQDYAQLAATMDPADVNRVVRGAAARLEQLVRPMDVVTRPRADTLAVLVHQDSIEQCRGSAFKRIQRELDTVKVETAAGVRRVRVAMAVGAVQLDDGIPTADEFMSFTTQRLQDATGGSDGIAEGIWGAAT